MYSDRGVSLHALSGNSVLIMVCGPDGKFWVVSSQTKPNRTLAYLRLVCFNPVTGEITRHWMNPPEETPECFRISHQAVKLIHKDSNNRMWFQTLAGGLDLFDPKDQRFYHYRYQADDPLSLSANDVTCLFNDSMGGLWIGTETGGVNYYHPSAMKFPYYAMPEINEAGNNIIVSIFVSPFTNAPHKQVSKIWIGTAAGLNYWDREKGKIVFHQIDPNIPDVIPYAIYQNSAGYLWLGTGLGLYRSGRSLTNNVEPLEKMNFDLIIPRESAQIGRIVSIIPDRLGNLWLSSLNIGLLYYNCATQKIENVSKNDTTWRGIPKFLISRAADNRLWVYETHQLYRFDPETSKLSPYRSFTEECEIITRISINTVFDDNKGNLWIGTDGSGLIHIDLMSNSCRSYTTEHGLIRNNVRSIAADRSGRIWIATDKGLSMFDPQMKRFTNYDIQDGLANNDFYPNALLSMTDDEIILGGSKGLYAFYPDKIKENRHQPDVMITGFQLSNEAVIPGRNSILKHPIEVTDSIELTYKHRIVSFQYTALDYVSPPYNQYAYQLKGFDDHWSYVGNRKFATYTNLPAGDYVFQVKAANGDGCWSENSASLAIHIAPPPWRTWWAYLIGLFIVSSMIYFVFQYREQHYQLKLETLEKDKIEIAHNKKIEELMRARDVQLSMLPRHFPTIEKLSIAAFMHTADEVGGDYYDFRLINDHRLLFCLGDVSGHGIASGLVVSVAKTFFHTIGPSLEQNLSLPDALSLLNTKMIDFQLHPGYGICFLMGIIDTKEYSLKLVNSGIPYPYLIRTHPVPLDCGGIPLGYISETRYQQLEMKLAPDDMIFCFSDGLNERINSAEVMLGEEGLKDIIHKSIQTNLNLSGINQTIFSRIEHFAGQIPQQDDMTAILFKIS